MRRVGDDPHLPAAVAARLDAELEQRHREEADRHLLAGGGDHVELARIGMRLDFPGERDQAIGLARHGRGHDHDLVAGGAPLRDTARDIADALDRAHRGAAEFLNDQRHRAAKYRKKRWILRDYGHRPVPG